MKRQELLTVLIAAAGITVAGSASAAINSHAGAALDAAVAKGSAIGLEEFLTRYPTSPLASEALGEMIKLAHHKDGHSVGDARGFLSSGNPKAAGGPDNPGVGNPHTPDC